MDTPYSGIHQETKFQMFKNLSLMLLWSMISACGQSPKIDKSELREIFFDILSVDSLSGKYYLIDSIEKIETTKIEISGTTYLVADCEIAKNGIWTESIYDSLAIISKNRLDSLTKGNKFEMTPANYSFSLPYFSKDKQSFIIYYNRYCGILCAEYSLRVYKKINGKWIFIKSVFSIIS